MTRDKIDERGIVRGRHLPVPANVIRRLRTRMLVEIYAIFLIVQMFLVFASKEQPDVRVEMISTASILISAGASALVNALLLIASDRLASPLYRYLAGESSDHRHPISKLRKGVLLLPARQSMIFAVPWVGMMITTAVITPLYMSNVEVPILAVLANAFAGLAVVAVVRMRVEALWQPFVPIFFDKDIDPTKIASARRFTLGRRFMRTYMFASVFPLAILTVSIINSTRVDPISATQVRMLTISAVVVGAILGAIGIFALSKSTLQQVHKLQVASQQVAAGNLDIRITVDRADELGDLAVAFDEMVDGLRTRDRIADLFERQVGADVARYSLGGNAELGGTRKEITAMFVDLAGFTTITEEHTPEDVVALLNRVFGAVVGVVTDHGGSVNKFEGDAALAVFGAPAPLPEHRHCAVLAGAEIQEAFNVMGIEFGVGIATGSVVAGNVGSEFRYEYTVIGDAVNLAARLEEHTRHVPSDVLVAGSTVDGLSSEQIRDIELKSIGMVEIRGKRHPIEAFALN